MPLGGFATSRSPLAAVAARGAEDNINDDVVDGVGVILKLQCLCILSLLLRATDTLPLAIRDLETFYYSPLRGNMGSYVLEWQCKGSLSSTRSPRRPCVLQSIRGTGEIVSEQVCHNFVGTVYKHL